MLIPLFVLFLSGNDSGSTGDASSTAGEAQSPDGAAAAAVQLPPGYDGTPLVCIPSKLVWLLKMSSPPKFIARCPACSL